MVHRLHVLLLSTFLVAACGTDNTFDGRDRRAPKVVSVVPADGTADVPTVTEVTVVYDEALRTQDFDMASFQVIDAAGNVADGFMALNNDQITFRPSKPYAFSTLYTVKLTSNVRDLFGNRAKPFQATFTTVPDREPPSPPYNLAYNPLTNLSTAVISGAKDPGTTLRVNDVDVASTAASANFEVTVQLPNEGANAFKFVATDEGGNASGANHITITRDQAPPAGLSLCAGASGLAWQAQGRTGCWAPPNPLYWNNVQLPIGAVWTPGVGEVAFVRFGNQPEHPFGSASFEFDLLSPGIPAGPVSLVIGVRDLAGNETPALQRTFIYDDAPPTLFPNFDDAALAMSNVTSGTLQFTKGNDAVAFFAMLDGVATGSCLSQICTIPYANLSQGLHRFAVAATDAAGNTTTILKSLTVDTLAPEAIVVPRTGSATGLTPTLHVFTREPVTASSLTLTDAAFVKRTVNPVQDITTSGRHWFFTVPNGLPLSEGAQTAQVSLYDAAGNVAALTWSFASHATTDTSPVAATFAGPVTSGSRDGTFTLTGLPAAAAVNVVVFQKNNLDGSLELVASTTGEVTATTEPLSLLKGFLHTYNSNGVSTSTILNETPWNHMSTAGVTFTGTDFPFAPVPFPFYGTAISYASGSTAGFNLLTGDGYWFQLETGGYSMLLADAQGCTVNQRVGIHSPYALDSATAVAGIEHCDGTDTVELLNLGTHTRSPLWTSPNGAMDFGAAIAGGRLLSDVEQTLAVGAPGSSGSVYVYANAASDTPPLKLQPDLVAPNNKLGVSLAIAQNHRPGTATLAVVRAQSYHPGSPSYTPAAIYFYDGQALRTALTPSSNMPLAPYRSVFALPTNESCIVKPFRQEVLSPGDIDGDGSDDFVVGSWDDILSCGLEVSIRIFLGGPGASDGNPIVLDQNFARRHAEEKVRLIPLGDLNADGLADFGYTDTTQNGLIRVFYGDRSGTPRQRLLRPLDTAASQSWALIGAMQADSDAYPEFILSNYYDLDQPAPALNLMIWP